MVSYAIRQALCLPTGRQALCDFDGEIPRQYPRKELEMPISKELLDILACPKCKGEIFVNKAGDGLICKSCRLLYQIKDDIPVMLIDEALPYGGEE